ncbi:ClpB protein [hydrothermal vent metagenome]|uniref:ClpB protein n=1 Tax=hydrothermal vent metagenome TaxID=652676 RepID=A0A3B0YU16_9ZZZZ
MEIEHFEKARWMRDLSRFCPLKSQFLLFGNVRDLQIVNFDDEGLSPVSLVESLNHELQLSGYSQTLIYCPTVGFYTTGLSQGDTESINKLLSDIGLSPKNGRAEGGLEVLSSVLQRWTQLSGEPVALVIDFASRLVNNNDNLSTVEHDLFSRAMVLSTHAQSRPCGEKRTPFYNSIIWIVEKESDLPAWLLVNNPKIRSIPIAKPDQVSRKALSQPLLEIMPGATDQSSAQLNELAQEFVNETEGMLLADLKSIAMLGRAEEVPVTEISDAVRRYKVGVTEDPWSKIDQGKIRNGKEFIQKRLKGQTHAVTHVLDIVKRAVTGVGSSRRNGRPRGIAFLAGPTGVGKTELAKTLTSLLFGDERAYIRFDMSEFSAEHSDQRLIGAPPGYVGYDMGGELTNAIKEKPFSVVLFDEIEKAHPRILDKFLQILDDGVLTSGRGDSVYFSECLIIFTSNLGIFKIDGQHNRIPNVTPSDPYSKVQEKVLEEIEDHFNLELNRPEILNRIGENIIVFDFIRKEVAAEIFTHMVTGHVKDLLNQKIDLTMKKKFSAAIIH